MNASNAVESADHLQLHQQAHSTQTAAAQPSVLDNNLQQIQQQTAQQTQTQQAQYTQGQQHSHHPMAQTNNSLVMPNKETIDYNNYANQALAMQTNAGNRLPHNVPQQNLNTDRRNQTLTANLYNSSNVATTAASFDPNQLHYQVCCCCFLI